ncbi:MAG: alpha-amylase family glycosyl hydrolase [Acidobacteriota bacterium]
MSAGSTDGRSGWRRIAYADEPDFTRPLLEIPTETGQRMFGRLRVLYGAETARETMPELVRLIRVHHAHKTDELIEAEHSFDPAQRFSERDLLLVAYGDMVRSPGHTPLAALGGFLQSLRRRVPVFNTLHILPFFPYSSDRGFSITDFRAVDPSLGSWQDIEDLGKSFRLMFDGVFNHASSKSTAFREMLSGNPACQDFAVTFHSKDELTAEQRNLLRRPRTSDILTMFHSINGPVWAWTTFSPDQIDLNYRNPKVLLGVIDTLLLYVRKGADLVRLDAATYLWEEPGTPSANLEQTHEIIRLFRDVLDVAAPHVALVTETNVPHAENIAYFGDGTNEAQMVYNFALPPLVLHAFYREDASRLSQWVRELEYPVAATTYLNVLDTHDGIGLPGVADILPPEELEYLIGQARQHGAFISYRHGERGGQVPYEINSTWYSALNMDNSGEERAFQVKRFVASRSIALALRGVPGIYFHGLIGSRNDIQLALRTRAKRDVNRAVLDEALLMRNLAEPGSKLNLINDQLGRLLEMRGRHRAFHPKGAQRVHLLSPQIFAVLRVSPGGEERILALTNVTAKPCSLEVPLEEIGVTESNWYDLAGGRGWMAADGKLGVRLQPYDVMWLAPFSELERNIESAVP